MRTVLSTETLKTGEQLTIECVTAPDAERESQITPFLCHKPPNYRAHIDLAFRDACGPLETRFYIGLIGSQMVGNIMTSEYRGVGILGHVNTREDHRRKGIASLIMQRQMEDFRSRKGKALLLSTGYQRPPYFIYQGFGFRDWDAGTPGLMRWDDPADPGFEQRFYAPASAKVVEAGWEHWPLVGLTAAAPAPAYLRSIALGIWGTGLVEGSYSNFLYQYQNDPDSRPRVLESETGAVLALATCIPDERWRKTVRLLDVLAHPSADPQDLTLLIESLPQTRQRVQCYADVGDEQKKSALAAAGFRHSVTLPEQFQQGEQWRNVLVYVK